MTMQEFEAAVKAENFDTVSVVERLPGYDMGTHQHAFDAFALITSGAITLVVDGFPTTYAVGDTFRLPVGTPHLESAPTGVTYLSARREITTP